ncbi:MAG: CaiB/BaiF CoA transferase family protein [Acidimicrobiia bacterium]
MGPLSGIRVIELAGMGPAPFAAMMLSDMGAEVIRIDRPDRVQAHDAPNVEVLNRGRRSVAIDCKHPDGVAAVLRLVERADALIEGFRPGVVERLGIGPDACAARNPRLVYGRMTGWGQDGPWAARAGHDINYIALAGVLAHLGRADAAPTPPANLIGDFGGGGMLLAFGVVCGILEAQRSGTGQVIDAAMIDGAALLMTMLWGYQAMGHWSDARGTNLLDTGAPFYDTYRTSDGHYVAIGALEPQFYAQLIQGLGIAETDLPAQGDRSQWPVLRERISAAIASKTRAEWDEIFAGSDACYAPVLTMREAAEHPHAQARQAMIKAFGTVQPAPAPRFTKTPGAIAGAPAWPGEHSDAVLADWGFTDVEVQALRATGAIA